MPALRLVLVTIALFASLACTTTRRDAPRAIAGALDLRSWDLDRDGVVSLDGEWQFHWGRLLAPDEARTRASDGFFLVPGKWNGHRIDGVELGGHGAATLRLEVTHAPGARVYALRVPHLATAYRLFADGRLVSENGVPSESSNGAVPEYLPRTVDLYDDDGSLEVVLQISNFHHRLGGPWFSLELGTPAEVHERSLLSTGFQIFLLGVFAVTGPYHLLLWALRRRDRSPLWFGAFALAGGARTAASNEFVIAQALPNIPWAVVIRLEYLGVFLSALALAMFLRELFPHEFPRWLSFPVVAVSGALGFAVLVTPANVFTHLMYPFQWFAIGAWCVASWALARAARARREGAVLFLAGWLAFIVTIANDMLYTRGHATVPLYPLGLTVFVFLQAVLLSKRFTSAFLQVASMTRELDAKNVELKDQIAARSGQLSDALARLATQELGPAGVAAGDVIDGRWRIVRELGRGGVGSVWEVERVGDGVRLALKVLESRSDFGSFSRFAREAQIAAGIDHPRLVDVIDVRVSDAGRMYLVMELVDGPSLAEIEKPLRDVPRAIRLLFQMCEGLAALHHAGVVHRDLKPSNVLLARSGAGESVKIADFGIARIVPAMGETIDVSAVSAAVAGAGARSLSGSASLEIARTVAADDGHRRGRPSLHPAGSAHPSGPLTQTGALIGTPMFMAPELVHGTRLAAPSSDLFSVGLIAHDLFTGRLPWLEPPILTRIRGGTVEPAASLGERAELPRELVELVDACLDLDPAMRPTAHELAERLAVLVTATAPSAGTERGM